MKLRRSRSNRYGLAVALVGFCLIGVVSYSVLPTVPPYSNMASAVTSQSAKPTIKGILVTANHSLENVVEGDSIAFKARLLFSDGSTKAVKGVVWSLLGPIGAISSTGVFEAKLDDSVSEFGQSVGVVLATYKTVSTTIIGNSGIFIVHMYVPTDNNTDG